MKRSALIIGQFTATETGFKGKLDTLAIKAGLTVRAGMKIGHRAPRERGSAAEQK